MTTWPSGPPVAAPLDTPDQLFSWEPGTRDSELCRAAVPLPHQVSSTRPASRPRLLACHDMRGGYAEDRLVQGGADADFYYLRHWHSLDLFVYFSHRLVTIPPPGWVNAAHTHDAPVLGTLITEWDAGAAHCCRLFGSVAAAEEAAGQLAAIAQYHGFEGWVINIENEMEEEHIPNLLHFIQVLTAQMRIVTNWSQVIWYDAVTTEGHLEWQNTLNNLNRPFFDACDGIWINYTWKEGTPALVRQEAGGRSADVYMGVDCFGRGTYGGGGFGCDVALAACLKQGLSAALFATGWPYEGDCGPGASTCWRQRDARFWLRIESAWSAGGGRALGGIARQLPLWTNFSVGCGQAVCQAGRQLWPCAWFNLSLQALQPLLRVRLGGVATAGSGGNSGGGSSSCGGCKGNGIADDSSGGGSGVGSVQAEISEDLAFSGGNSVRLSGSLLKGQRAVVELFAAAIPLPPAGLLVRLVTTASDAVKVQLALRLAPASASGSRGAAVVTHIATGTAAAVPPGWVTWHYSVGHDSLATAGSGGVLLSGVDLVLLGPGEHAAVHDFQLHLGELCIEEAKPTGGAPEAAPSSVEQPRCSSLQLRTAPGSDGEPATTFSARLSWQPPPGGARCCHLWYAFSGCSGELVDPRWLGTACTDGYWVTDLLMELGSTTVTFWVQPVGGDGRPQPLKQAARVEARVAHSDPLANSFPLPTSS